MNPFSVLAALIVGAVGLALLIVVGVVVLAVVGALVTTLLTF